MRECKTTQGQLDQQHQHIYTKFDGMHALEESPKMEHSRILVILLRMCQC